MGKVVELNLELGWPTVEEAIRTMTNALSTYKKVGYKAVIIIHGYGSSGAGGGIKPAVRRQLLDRALCGLVRDFVGGEEWSTKKREYIGICRELEKFERSIADNAGVTIVLLKK
ncbi:MAG: hypothetical protein DDT34_01332 [Firmicutes bacterium]|nr:hypothetical protein [Bacillota bacterium]MBT9157302.1 hypothetical protein [Bacillota bacterium]